MSGKIIVIEGTDCSGKETQSKLLLKKLELQGYKTKKYSFPNYGSPTGDIVGGPFLGKKEICEGWFKEGSSNVDYRVSSLYYAADRLYMISNIINDLNNDINVILDRYTYSNMAHQGCKVDYKDKRIKVYSWIEELEFNLLDLPKADIKVLLYMPTEFSNILKEKREILDQNEKDEEYLKRACSAYLEVADLYDFKIIDCIENNSIRSIENINQELFDYVLKKLDD